MRFVTWNAGHRRRRRQMTPELALALASTRPDILVLTDYMDDVAYRPFHETLVGEGLSERIMTPRVEGQRQVAIMSSERLTPGDIQGCALSAATRPNWLHVRTSGGINVVGFRVPLFRKPRLRPAYWDWLVHEALPQLVGHPSVLLGDFNAAPNYRPVRTATLAGWQVGTPPGGWSAKSPSGKTEALDHALVSPHFRIRKTEYVRKLENQVLAGSATAWSDHAALVLDVELRPE